MRAFQKSVFLWTRQVESPVRYFVFVIIPVWFNCQDAEVPWHLIAIAAFFTFVKLLGPYYPYWGRVFIPHFANGGLWRTLWFAFLRYRRPQKELTAASQQNFVNSSHSEPNEL